MEVLLASLANTIYTRVQNVKVYKHRCSNLSSRCNLLVNALREDEAGTTGAHADAINEARSTLEVVMRRVDRWANLSTMRSFIHQHNIRCTLEELDSRVDTCLSRYRIRMDYEMTRAREEHYEAMREDHDELREMFNEFLRSSIQYSNDRTRSPALQVVMEDIQEEHREAQTVASANIPDDIQSLHSQQDPVERGFQQFCKSLVTLELNQPINQIAQARTPPRICSSRDRQPRSQASVGSMRSLVSSWLASSTSLRPPQIPPLELGGDVVWHNGPWTAAPLSPLSEHSSFLSAADPFASPSGHVSAPRLERINSARSGASMSSTRSALSGASTSRHFPTLPTPGTCIPSAPHSPLSPLNTWRASAQVSLTPLATALTTRASCYIWKSDTKRRVLSKATMEGLIDYFLFTPAADDPEQHNSFFIGHFSVISPRDVFQRLKWRFEEAMVCPSGIRNEIQYCVVRLINDWLKNVNVNLGQVLLTDMKDFVSTITANGEVPPDGIVLQIVQGIQAKASMNLPPPPITSSFNPDIHQGPTPTDLAFALARQEAEIYRRIMPSEFVAHACGNEDGCANLSAAFLLTRRIKFWVQSSILDLEFGMDKAGLERRSETKLFFIIVAEECYNISNFSSFHTIVDALQSPVVAGLALTHSRMLPREQRRMTRLVKTSLERQQNKPLPRCIPWYGAHLETIKALIQDPSLSDVDERHNPPMLNCEKWIALRDAAMSAVRFQDMLHMYESLPADRQRRDTAVEYLRALLRKIHPEEDLSQALQLKSDSLKASEESLRTGRPMAPLQRPGPL